MGDTPATKPALKQLKITCTSTDCDADLHCFRASRKLLRENNAGACRSCGARLIDWDRVHMRRADDVDFTLEQLKRELVRHHFWHLEFDQRAVNHARRKGRIRLNEAARHRIETSIRSTGNGFDGRQTPRTGNTIYYAQHATASCCRRCVEYWHGIPMDRDLTAEEGQYLSDLVVRYLDERLPSLRAEPERVPPIRSGEAIGD